MKPDFICIGAQKAGTGWLYEQLRHHPDFWMPPVKELHYFDRDWRTPRVENRFEKALRDTRDDRDRIFLHRAIELFRQAELSLKGYSALFEPAADRISGDITPGYSVLPEDRIEMIARHLPEVRIVFLVRDPVERAWSQLSMWIRHGRLERFDPTDAEAVIKNLSHPDVLARSFPSRIAAKWRRVVPADRFHLFFFDDLKSAPDEVRRELINRLGADPGKSSGDLPAGHNAKAGLEKLGLTDEVREQLAEFFKEELLASAAQLGGAARQWPGRYGF